MEKITFDKRNYRRHDEKNKRVIRKSLEELGAGRSVVIDKEGALIAGNGVYEQAQKLKMPVRVVETDGSELVVVKRTDLATGDEKRKRLALADNVASDLSDFDDDLLHEDFSMEELGDWGLESEEEVSEADVEHLFEDAGESKNKDVLKVIVEIPVSLKDKEQEIRSSVSAAVEQFSGCVIK